MTKSCARTRRPGIFYQNPENLKRKKGKKENIGKSEALRLAILKGTIIKTDYRRLITELERIPNKIKKVLKADKIIEKIPIFIRT